MPTSLLVNLISVLLLISAFVLSLYMPLLNFIANSILPRTSFKSLSIGWPNHLSFQTQKTIKTMASESYSTITYVTVPNHETGRNLSKLLVNQRLAACVNIVKSMESVYEWKDQVEIEEESLLIIKSSSEKTKDLTEFIEKHHPYDCPEVVTLKIKSGSAAYLKWIHETINKKPIE